MNEPLAAPGYRSVRENPWWIPFFLGGVPASLSKEHLALLGVLTFALFFERYDLSIFSNALKQLGESFTLDKSGQGYFAGLVQLGALPAVLIVPLADRVGRRRLLLFCVVMMSAGSMLTAASQSAAQFVLVQFATRSFLISAALLTIVIVAEEFPAESRGWGIGMLSGVSAIGFGLGALLFGFVNKLPFGWRTLYLVGVAPLLLLPWLRRGIRETQRFHRARGAELAREGVARALAGALQPIGLLVRDHPRRALVLGLIGSLSSLGISVAFFYLPEFLQSERGWSPGSFAAMSVFFGAIGIVGNPVAGRMADRYGRRTVIVAALIAFPLFTAAFYAGPAKLVSLPWTGMVFLNMAGTVMLRALTTELFPTKLRGAAGGTQAMLETLGAASGSFAYGIAMKLLPNQSLVLPLLSLATILAATAVALIPETARRELEEISDEGA
jgi:MFS family permease